MVDDDVVLTVQVEEDGSLFLRDLEGLAGQMVDVRIRRAQPRRSKAMIRFYRGVVVPLLAEHCGESRADMDAILKRQFGGEAFEGDLSPNSAAAFTAFVDACIREAARMGVVIPPPRTKEQ